jgi:hypothetical protein
MCKDLAKGWRNRVQFSLGAGIFPFIVTFRPVLGPTRLTGSLSVGIKQCTLYRPLYGLKVAEAFSLLRVEPHADQRRSL